MFDPRTLPPERGPREPIFKVPPATLALALLIFAVWLFLQVASQGAQLWVLRHMALIPEVVLAAFRGLYPWQEAFPTLVTHMFVHLDGFHMATNAGFLIAFASPFERVAGPWRFIAVFLLSGIAGALLFLALNLGNEPTVLLGASGGVFGLMGAALPLLRHRHNGSGLVRIMLVLMAINIGVGVLGDLGLFGDLRIGWEAHLGGFLVGLGLGWVWRPYPR